MTSIQSSSAVSELVGTLILIAVVSGAAGIIAVALLSQPVPPDIPSVQVVTFIEGNNLTLFNLGGDTLPEGSYSILVNGNDMTAAFQPPPSTTPFKIGENLTYKSTSKIQSVTLIYSGVEIPEGIVLFKKNFE